MEVTQKQQIIIDYLNSGYYLHLNEYIPFNQKSKKKIFFLKEYQNDKNDYKKAIDIDQESAKQLIKNNIVEEIDYHVNYSKTFLLKK